jgi:hypothetical protein
VRALALATLMLGLIAGSACGNCSCGLPYGNYASVMLTGKDASRAVPVGMFQTVGVVLEGSGRVINVSDAGRLVPFPVGPQPDGMTLELFRPDAPEQAGTPFEFGGAVVISAPASGPHPEWMATLVIGSDPRGDGGGGPFVGSGAFAGSGTTVMALGQSFVVSWPAGGTAPKSSDSSVLEPSGDPMLVHSGYQLTQKTSVTDGPAFLQQLFVGVGVGTATFTLPDAIHTVAGDASSYGGSQDFVIRLVQGFTCSPERGCVQNTAGGPDRPDKHYAANETPAG